MSFKNIIKFSVLVALGCVNLCFAETTTEQPLPSISFISPEQVADIGGTAELNCTFQDLADYSIMWNRKYHDRPTDSVSMIVGTTNLVRDSRFSASYDNATGTSTLKISNIEISDRGIYECQVTVSMSQKVAQNVQLLVRQPPAIDIQTVPFMNAAEGDSVKLICSAEGYPRPSITWTRANDAILPIGGSSYLPTGTNLVAVSGLEISRVHRVDRGIYYCHADNGVGKPIIENIRFSVEFAPIISTPRPKVAQALNYDNELICNVEANPPPDVVWKKDGKPVLNNDDFHISKIASVNDQTTSTLRVISVEESQYGDYICEASNKLGTAESRITLFQSVIQVINP